MHLPPAPSSKKGLHAIIRMLSLLLLQSALAPSIADANARSRLPAKFGGEPASEPTPYLKITNALALRFNDAPPPPAITHKPAAGAPPQPGSADAATPAPLGNHADFVPVARPDVEPQKKPDNVSAPLPAPMPFNATSSLVPDDTRPSSRPEDFLPFFQLPGGNGDVSLLVPASLSRLPSPGALPPSSATYQQK